MRRSSLYSFCFLTAAIVAGVYSCKKTTGIDNNNVITTPFSLYFSDMGGALYHTNDGRNYSGMGFPPDGKPCRSLVTSGGNILWAKNHLYYSNNNGRNFNLTYDSLVAFPTKLCNGDSMNLNQSMLINITAWGNRVYTVSQSQNTDKNWLGVLYSDNFGNPRTWALDGSYDTVETGRLPVRMFSYTFLANGKLCGLAYSGPADGDNFHVRNFVKEGKDETVYANRWREKTANPDNIAYIYKGNLSGTPLPPFGATHVDTSYFTLGHMNNRLIAIDARCNYGAWYSDDLGANWTQYSGLPDNTPLLCIESPFEEVCLVGTAGKGLYILNLHTGAWEANNNGLASGTTVRGIAGKKNVFKNGSVRKFIYLATSNGIYESSDGGHNWVQTIPGNYAAVY
ncbi:hypothetical protein GCM10023093_08100 [Nemorincola caseinilytica]|uniref:Uncharacterized protein n=1 Tax=Nemorincola caseinilytica TaxID=2054315 RepID=A0ABP8N6E2_9BACT